MHVWKILITDGLHEKGVEIIQAAAQVDDRAGISLKALLETVSGYDALIVRGRTQVTAEVFAAAKGLKVVARAGVGVDNIDLEAANTQRVMVVNAPKATTLAVAEHTLGLLFALARMIPRADAGMKSGHWLKQELSGVELSGKVLGLIGVGNIGSAVAQRAASLGMTVIGNDPQREDDLQTRGAEPVSKEELLARSDFISLHVPLAHDTRGMVDGQALASMKRGVGLVCTARGGIIDELALLEALESGQVAGAALDVFAQEPPGLTALVTHPNVIATPHISGQTAEAQARAAVDIANEVLAALGGGTLRWRVI